MYYINIDGMVFTIPYRVHVYVQRDILPGYTVKNGIWETESGHFKMSTFYSSQNITVCDPDEVVEKLLSILNEYLDRQKAQEMCFLGSPEDCELVCASSQPNEIGYYVYKKNIWKCPTELGDTAYFFYFLSSDHNDYPSDLSWGAVLWLDEDGDIGDQCDKLLANSPHGYSGIHVLLRQKDYVCNVIPCPVSLLL